MANNDQEQLYETLNSAYSNLLSTITPTLSGDQVFQAVHTINRDLVSLHQPDGIVKHDSSRRQILGITKDREFVVYTFDQPGLHDYNTIPPEELKGEIENNMGHYDERKESRPDSLSEANHREYQRNKELLVELEDLVG